MANGAFENYLNLTLDKDGSGANAVHVLPDMLNDTIKCHLYDTGAGAVDLAAWEDEADVPDGTATTGILSTATMTGQTVGAVGVGVFDCDDFTFTAVDGDQAESLIFWQDTATDTTSPLIVHFDNATGLPVTPSGSDIDVVISASGLFQIG